MNQIKLLPCPFCGMQPPENDLIDTLYPSGTYFRFINQDDE